MTGAVMNMFMSRALSFVDGSAAANTAVCAPLTVPQLTPNAQANAMTGVKRCTTANPASTAAPSTKPSAMTLLPPIEFVAKPAGSTTSSVLKLNTAEKSDAADSDVVVTCQPCGRQTDRHTGAPTPMIAYQQTSCLRVKERREDVKKDGDNKCSAGHPQLTKSS